MKGFNEWEKNKEISKLIQFGFDLHEKDMKDYRHDVPNYEFYNGYSCPMKKIDGGAVFGYRNYPNHSEARVCTILGVCIMKKKYGKSLFESGYIFETDNEKMKIYPGKLKLNDTKKWHQILEYDNENSWQKMTVEQKLDAFVKSMEFIGFNKQDVLDVINGKITAREAYMNVAAEEIKNLQWVNKSRRHFVFDDNVAIEGNFSSLNLDYFPFPFDKQPILDCSRVKTCYVRFDTNKNKVKLINVNQNQDSICHTDLTNAIIDEVIDLSVVDATNTKFGNQKVINLDRSIAKLSSMDLSLALNEKGERFVVDNEGIVQLDNNSMPKTIWEDTDIDNVYNIKVFANADNYNMAHKAFLNNADGIGLVRTEYIFEDLDDIKNMLNLVINYPDTETSETILNRLKELQQKQVKEILLSCKNKKIIFRLMDFKTSEFLKMSGYNCDKDEYYISALRGAALLEYRKDILIKQLESIFEVVSKIGCEVNLLIPMLEDVNGFEILQAEIIKIANKYDIKNLKIGAMIENTMIVNNVDLLAKQADFICIGTNDLTESVTGLSRSDKSIDFQELNNEVKRLIKNIVHRARTSKEDILIGICGEHSNYISNLEFYKKLNINYITCDFDFVKANKEFLSLNATLENGISKTYKRKNCKKNNNMLS